MKLYLTIQSKHASAKMIYATGDKISNLISFLCIMSLFLADGYAVSFKSQEFAFMFLLDAKVVLYGLV